MASFKVSVRIAVVTLIVSVFASSCAQIMGDLEVVPSPPEQVIGGITDPAPPPVSICNVGETKCMGELLQLCTDGGTAWVTLQVCGSAALCESSGLSTVSDCLRPTCARDEMSCNGNMLRACNDDRNGWEEFDACESAAHCNAANRQCDPAPCLAGERRCNAGSLEACQDDRLDWQALDACSTNELCLATLESARDSLLAGATADEAELAAALDPDLVLDVSACLTPACLPGEVRCEGARLDLCNEGRTAFAVAEECATDVLCAATLTYVGTGGRPRCRQAVCNLNEHQCTESGILQACTAGRESYQTIATCIGPPFCNSVAADNGAKGCEDAPCLPGQMQCNGAQIQRCRDDRTRFDVVDPPCETRDLCNDDDPANAFCAPAACQRGQFSGTEFRCQGATLQRCNDQHTAYETLNTCASAGLCNPGLAFAGCQEPVCDPGETACNGDFLQICNGQRTGFDNVERCGAGRCDSNAGRCADPCVLGSARCNAQGQLEECRNLLTGREVTALCASPQLCDANARTCRQPPLGCNVDGQRRCRAQGADTLLEVCTDGRSRFALLDSCGPGEFCDVNNERCDECNQASQATCEGNELVTCAPNGQTKSSETCDQGCLTQAGADRCRACAVGSASCDGRQLVVCEQGTLGEIFDRDDCDSAALCQETLAGCGPGQPCQCKAGVCDATDVGCNGRQPLRCRADLTDFEPAGPPCTTTLCDPDTGTCDLCLSGDKRCLANGTMEGCSTDGSSFLPILLPGTALCLSPSGPSQRCSGVGPVTSDDCESGICLDGVGCVECDANDFDQVCVNTPSGPARTECSGGEEIERPCTNQSGACFVAVCDANGCNTQPRCNGALPFCVGNGQCVECIDSGDCSDGEVCGGNVCVQCVEDQCRNGVLRRCSGGVMSAPVTCGFPNACNAGGTACETCSAARDCSGPDACTAAQCLANGTGCVNTSSCAATNQICSPGGTCVNAAACGDGNCLAPDTTVTCPADCGSRCGDATCNGTETTANCSADCGDACGDGVATGTEACDSSDLRNTPGCSAGELGSVTCSGTCTVVRTCAPGPSCGDGVINGAEACDTLSLAGATCQTQGFASGTLSCAPATCTFNTSQCTNCGNTTCDAGENFTNCAADCIGCGDGTCNGTEDFTSCPVDCIGCGDGTCNGNEDATSCPGDCVSCGDLICSAGEDLASCPGDCPAAAPAIDIDLELDLDLP